jgi:NADPH:quinone reductase-like Zn-dependent oxidoreductase
VRATSLNYRDLMVLKDGVTRFVVGDRVIGCFHPRWFGGPIKGNYLTDRLGANLDGMLAEYAVVSEEAAVAMPSHLSFEEAATLPCAAVTAWVALTGHRRVTAGDTVLTQGSGGVSIFALQFARLLGAQVIATTSSAAKAERLRALGVAAVVNYVETPDWHEKVVELTDGRGADCVVEIGGAGTLTNSIKALAVGGHISLIGSSLSRSGVMLDPLLLGGRGMTLGSISVGSRADFEAMNRAIALHRLRPVVDRVFPFEEAPDAYRYFESRAHFGKVVVSHGWGSCGDVPPIAAGHLVRLGQGGQRIRYRHLTGLVALQAHAVQNFPAGKTARVVFDDLH